MYAALAQASEIDDLTINTYPQFYVGPARVSPTHYFGVGINCHGLPSLASDGLRDRLRDQLGNFIVVYVVPTHSRWLRVCRLRLHLSINQMIRFCQH